MSGKAFFEWIFSTKKHISGRYGPEFLNKERRTLWDANPLPRVESKGSYSDGSEEHLFVYSYRPPLGTPLLHQHVFEKDTIQMVSVTFCSGWLDSVLQLSDFQLLK